MIKRLIFDIDNTLICNIDYTKAVVESFKEYGITPDENKVEKLKEAMDTYENYNKGYDREKYIKFLSQEIETELNDNYLDILLKNLVKHAISKYNEKLEKTINTLSKQYETVLLSNYFEKSQRGRLEKIGINKYFTEYYGEKICKPGKQAYIDAIGKNKPEECIMIGDNIDFDIVEAQKCGINTIWINPNNKIQNKVKTVSVKNIPEINNDLIKLIENNQESEVS